ncbi:MAG TPA: 3-hydroxyacyl-CoA dehydrogenase family protein [Chryseolinea sp.]
MNILIIGDTNHVAECKEKFGASHQYSIVDEHRDAEKFLQSNELVFDFIIEEEPHQFEIYCNHRTTVFLNTCKINLAELVHLLDRPVSSTLFGFNGMPTFLRRNTMEVSCWRKGDEDTLKKICDQLMTDFLIVDDRVGLVTPRVVCMIINEAYYTILEGTATRDDVDLAMKLGSNYPFGPFEWTGRIGVKHVYELLEAVYEDTHDERYKICPLLKKEYLAAL